MQVMLGMLPMLVKEMKGERGKESQQRKGGKGKSFLAGTGPKGQWGDRISKKRERGKRLWEEKG